MERKSKSEKGQIIVILALALIALLGVTALAMDGGLVYSDRRVSQNTADSSALAGGGAASQILKDAKPSEFYCISTKAANAITAARQAAIDQAAELGVTLDTNISDQMGVSVTCNTTPYGSFMDIRVIITSFTETNFAKLVFRGPLKSVVETTVRVYPVRPLGFGNAIVSLSRSCGNIGGLTMVGDSHITISDGGIHSNSCMTGSGNIDVLVEDAVIEYYTTLIANGHPSIDPWPVATTTILPKEYIEDRLDCNSPGMEAQTSKPSGVLEPGIYSKIDAKGDLTLKPGLYCLDGDFTANATALLTAEDVTIYMRRGSLVFNGKAVVTMTAPDYDEGPGVPPAVRGLLIYMAQDNNGRIEFAGTPTNTFSGTIYAPNGDIIVTGTSDSGGGVELSCQLIGNKVDIRGTADILINFDGADLFTFDSSLDLLK